MAEKKIKPVYLKAKRALTKPADVSQEEWDSYAEARRISREQAKKPHPFARAHYFIQKSEAAMKAKKAKKKKVVIKRRGGK